VNPIQKIIADEIVEARFAQSSLTSYGFIISYDQSTNTATVDIFDKTIGAFVIYDKVPLPDTTNGVIPVNPSSRTPVWIDFVGGNKNYPRVSGVKVDSFDMESQASDGGSGVPGIGSFFNGLGNVLSGIFGGGGRK
jgi:hypothetical protein